MPAIRTTCLSAIALVAVATLATGGCGRGGPTAPTSSASPTIDSSAGSPATVATTSVTPTPPTLPSASPAALGSVFSVSADWPAASSTITGVMPGSWLAVRSDSRITSRLRIGGLEPGHVYNVHFVYFNHPEHCTNGSPKYSPPAACGAFGPMDPRDGAIPETQFSVVNYRGLLAGPSGTVVFAHKLGEDPPSEVVTGPGLTNPAGAQVFANVVDKGPELPAGGDRDLQYDTLRGGCVGPPYNGAYPCTFVGNALLR